MKRLLYLLLLTACFASCTTAKRLDKVSPGMDETQVKWMLGKPKYVGLNKTGRYYVYNYANHRGIPITGGRRNYYVQFKDNKVVSYGALSTMKNE